MKPTHVALGAIVSLFFLTNCSTVVATGSAATNAVTLQDRSFGSTINDANIYGEITEKLLALDSKEAYTGVAVEVFEGRVLMMGELTSKYNLDNVLRIAWSVNGVREVINEIQLVEGGRSQGVISYTSDALVTSQAKTRLVAERGIPSANYKIETINGIVYVIGAAQSEQELQKALYVISLASGARKVVSHVQVRPVYNPKGELPKMADPTIPPIS